MGKIRDHNFYAVCGWMVTRLGLKGRELHAYAIIYGFTQDRETEFSGSLSYISEWLGCTKKTTIETLKSLINKGLIAKKQDEICGVKVNYYKVILPPAKQEPTPFTGSVKTTPPSVKTTTGQCNNYHEGGVKITPNIYSNIYNNNIYTPLEATADSEKEKITETELFNKIKKLYNDICKSLPPCKVINSNREKAIKARMNEYKDIEIFATLFRMAEASSFLKGKNSRDWRASFDWLLNSANMAKVLEGNYNDKGGGAYADNGRTGAAGGSYGQAGPVAANVRTTAELEATLREQGQSPQYPDFDAL